MAFICPPRKDLLKKRRILSGIKSVLKDIERDMTANIRIEEPNQCCSPCCKGLQEQVVNKECTVEKVVEPPEVMVCYKIQKTPNKKKTKSNKVIRLHQSKSKELRASILYRGCLCEKRNGLQDDCPRTECHGKPECLTLPSPICGPSEFCDGKHLYKKLKKNQRARLGLKGDDSDAEDEYEFQCFSGSIEPKTDNKDDYCDVTNCPAYT